MKIKPVTFRQLVGRFLLFFLRLEIFLVRFNIESNFGPAIDIVTLIGAEICSLNKGPRSITKGNYGNRIIVWHEINNRLLFFRIRPVVIVFVDVVFYIRDVPFFAAGYIAAVVYTLVGQLIISIDGRWTS